MKVMVFPHRLEIGGSQTNAIELAAAARNSLGHDVVVFGTPGPALSLLEKHGLRFIPAPEPRSHPSLAMARSLRHAIRDETPDVIHAWEWPQCVDAFFAVHLAGVAPVVGSDMSMTVNRRLPRVLPVTFGTPQLVVQARRRMRGPVLLLEPPVDATLNRPGAADGDGFRRRHDLGGCFTFVIVSRLVSWLKLEGILRSIDAVARLRLEQPVRLVVVGGGAAEGLVARRAEVLNRKLGDRVVVLTGPLLDPRPAYAAADVVLGMGGSVLRGMAFAKPCVVLGERGFSDPFTPETSHRFLWQGFYGLGGDTSADTLTTQLRDLVTDRARLEQLGAFSRKLVEERFSLEAATVIVDELYRRAPQRGMSPVGFAGEGARTAFRQVSSAVARSVRRLHKAPMMTGQVSRIRRDDHP